MSLDVNEVDEYNLFHHFSYIGGNWEVPPLQGCRPRHVPSLPIWEMRPCTPPPHPSRDRQQFFFLFVLLLLLKWL